MSVFNPSKLKLTYLAPATSFRPVDARKYTLTHSDTTGELFLSVGCHYDYNAINHKFRDEVLAEWIPRMGVFTLCGSVYISGGEFDEKYSSVRFMIFKRELDLALQGIVYGDQQFFANFPWLLDSPIYIQFESVFPQFQQVIYYGTPRQYLLQAMQQPLTQV